MKKEENPFNNYVVKKEKLIEKIKNEIRLSKSINENLSAIEEMNDYFIRILNINGARLLCGKVFSLWGHIVSYDSDPVYNKIWKAYSKLCDIIRGDSDYRVSQHLAYLSSLAEKFHFRNMNEREYFYLSQANPNELQSLNLKEKMEESFISDWI